ncbi:multinuclear nonheme iron-dependent oxidase [Bacillus niameyensis]|uniref:multinuclear nonheme iron-dependent oxidase n=1 Tax=Bacillus niameyensis TaxID=1522308 RepID=UPI000785A9EA|nr:DUF692 family multinuclear iron-containing protein [Bacillus niameyensis]
MVQLGCNYSPQLLSLLDKRAVTIDWIKLSKEDTVWKEIDICRPYAPMLLHTLPHASLTDFSAFDFPDINKAVAACKSPHIALHLLAKQEDWDTDNISDEEIIDRMLKNVLKWKAEMDVDLLIENVPYYGFRGTLRPATDPEVITEICEQADVDLLLDLAHLRVATWHRQEDPIEYLQKLPLDRVREIHVCGLAPDPDKGHLRDRHLEMQDIDYELLTRTLRITNPKVVTLEYGGTGPKFEWRSEVDVLERQLKQLSTILKFKSSST